MKGVHTKSIMNKYEWKTIVCKKTYNETNQQRNTHINPGKLPCRSRVILITKGKFFLPSTFSNRQMHANGKPIHTALFLPLSPNAS